MSSSKQPTTKKAGATPNYRELRDQVRALFTDSRGSAFERCEPRFRESALHTSDGARIAKEILGTFSPSSFRPVRGALVPSWSEPNAPEWFKEDGRWLDLCIRLRRHTQLGAVSRHVLRYAGKDIVEVALKADLKANPPIMIRPTTASSGDLLQRYVNGDHTEVWRELRAHEALGGALLVEARAVAEATMTRVANAADVLAQRLRDRGWMTVHGVMRKSFSPEDAATLQELEVRTGTPLPASLRAFWQVVGSIDFVWDNGFVWERETEPPDLGVDLPMEEMDPLAISSAKSCDYLFEEWEEAHRGVHPELLDPYSLDLAADYLHKAGISGGAAYGVELPFAGADPVFANEEHDLAFVDYLRFAFEWGGFPRLEQHKEREDVKAFVADMSEGLAAF